jgi:hypothetical protein
MYVTSQDSDVVRVLYRRLSKQTKKNIFSLNRKEPKLNRFRLFHDTKNIFFGLLQFVSLFRTSIETTETNIPVLKQTPKQTEDFFVDGTPTWAGLLLADTYRCSSAAQSSCM